MQRAFFAFVAVQDIEKYLTADDAIRSAAVIAASPCPIYAMIEDGLPIAIAVCSLNLPGFARRLRFMWVDPGARCLPITLKLGRHVAASAPVVSVAVRSDREKRLCRMAGFNHWRRARGGWSGCTVANGFRQQFALPEMTKGVLADGMRALGVAGIR